MWLHKLFEAKFDEFVTCLFFQDSKKFFKRADLVRKEQEEYFKRCGFKVQKIIFVHISVQILFIIYPGIMIHFDAQDYERLCLLSCFFKPTSAACICRFRERLLRARYGMHGENPWLDAWWKDRSLSQSLLFPWHPSWNFFHFSDNYNGIVVEIAL